MNRVLGLTVPEIAEIDGAKAIRVNHAIKEVSGRVVTGKTILTNPSDDEVAAARVRIEKKRLRDRRQGQKVAA